MPSAEHNDRCPRPYRGDCRNFSTDGTRLGADIAHEFGTTDEDEIARRGEEELLAGGKAKLTGMTAEQAEWEGFEVNQDDDIYDEAWTEGS